MCSAVPRTAARWGRHHCWASSVDGNSTVMFYFTSSGVRQDKAVVPIERTAFRENVVLLMSSVPL